MQIEMFFNCELLNFISGIFIMSYWFLFVATIVIISENRNIIKPF